MLLQANYGVNFQIFGALPRDSTNSKYFSKSVWRSVSFQTCRGKRCLPQSFVSGISCAKMSSRIMEETQNNAVTKEFSEYSLNLPSYESTMEALSSLITRQKRGGKSSDSRSNVEKLDRMRTYLKILGLEEPIKDLKIIHVAGTKGKGSTCAFCEGILRECGFRTGLFTSPHLIDVRERFRINGLDVSEEKFMQYFWVCWYQLKENVSEHLPMPPLFQFLTLLAFKTFICEQVDVAIIEVGLGGMHDSTNVIDEPVVCGISSLGMDHMEALGDTIGKIAFHKAGILKPLVPAFTSPQHPEAMAVIHERAHELMAPLEVTEPLDPKNLKGYKLGLSGDHQLINSGLAVSLTKCWLQRTGNWERLFQNANQERYFPEEFCRGLSAARLSGRAQIVYDSDLASPGNSLGGLIFYLDGAHTPESMEVCAKWFSFAVKGNHKPLSSSRTNMEAALANDHLIQDNPIAENSNIVSKQVLLFNCMDVRDPQVLLPKLLKTCASSGTHFSKALFIPSLSTYGKVTSGASVIPSNLNKDLSWQFNLHRLWENMHGKVIDVENASTVESAPTLPPYDFLFQDASHLDNSFGYSAVMPSLPLTIKWLRDCIHKHPSVRVDVLVTGSLHLVGDVLKLLKRKI